MLSDYKRGNKNIYVFSLTYYGLTISDYDRRWLCVNVVLYLRLVERVFTWKFNNNES